MKKEVCETNSSYCEVQHHNTFCSVVILLPCDNESRSRAQAH